ncbi:MAG: hypothetical protein JW863_15895 [Chitinispirillaceae bacterium]|nr:hypothetical protein [Chitinispirillaceae bacterium]
MHKQMNLVLLVAMTVGVSPRAADQSAQPFIGEHITVAAKRKNRKRISVFLPPKSEKPVPMVLLLHKYGQTPPEEYAHLINHINSLGHGVMYPPINRFTLTREHITTYKLALDDFEDVLAALPGRFDTTQLAVVGHGFGGGAAPAITRMAYQQKSWGTNNLLLYIMAPWYTFGIDKTQLAAFPKHAKLVMQVFEDDNINDPRIGLDLYNTIGLPGKNKAFLFTYSDRRIGDWLVADNATPLGDAAFGGEENELDSLMFRVYSMSCAASFSGDTAGFAALRNSDTLSPGKPGEGKPFKATVVTDSARSLIISRPYINPWISVRNPSIEVSRFRRARRAFVKFHRRTWKQYATHVKTTIKERIGANEDFSVMENPIAEGYGADGTCDMDRDSFTIAEEVTGYLFTPHDYKDKYPVCVFLHGYIGQEPEMFEPFITHIVSRGVAVLFPSFPFFPKADSKELVLEKYRSIYAGIDSALSRCKNAADTSRVAFFGQSFGAGAVPSVAYRLITERGWGGNGACMFLSAPWYIFGISDEQLKNYPLSVKLIVEVYDNDNINDHHMAVDFFKNVGIKNSEKDYITLYSSSHNGVVMNANHFVAYGIESIYGEENLLDHYGIFRFFDALIDYAFTGNKEAYKICLGGGTSRQRYMGHWDNKTAVQECRVTDDPQVMHQQWHYMWPWEIKLNPRYHQ